ncbi:DUF4307 domain-containing protein [Phaeacidiphilus oryzae]|jgi:hypothetical protein|uniref:DUF4307 domain-containing protein n=1 Tax=Phaeacidiphilus oryzae TaxID=348818 RepID=UPI0005613CD7|nr:DUF4307 domain-containing protein [Phaeacidiphilus oryzae]
MSATARVPGPSNPAGRPAGRYGGGPRGDATADRKLKRIGLVLGILAVCGLVALAVSYLQGAKVSGEVVAFQVTGDHAVQVHLGVDKSSGSAGTCTLSALDTDQAEVGRITVPIPAKGDSYDSIVTIRTIHRATAAQLVSCSGK